MTQTPLFRIAATILTLLAASTFFLSACGSANDDDDASPTDSPTVPPTDLDADGYPRAEDCDDEDASVFPGAEEMCDGVDNDCDEDVDEGFDADDDGFVTCEVDTSPADCDDTRPDVYPGAEELCDGVDNGCEGTNGPGDVPPDEVDEDGDGFIACEECDDTRPDVHPGAEELCDGVDNDCEGTNGPGDVPPDEVDEDGDGFIACEECDDTRPDAHPGAEELCDGVDNDCDEDVDEDFNEDGDGFTTCGDDTTRPDCDDTRPDVYPGAEELCDGVDNDCDSVVPSAEIDDNDVDGFLACEDCNDDHEYTYPGAEELCDGEDNDCDGSAPGEADTDQDGYRVCSLGTPNSADCDDNAPDVHPGALEDSEETCTDDIDNDCDGLVDNEDIACSLCEDNDEDGWCVDRGDCDDDDSTIHHGVTEVRDCIDQDCDGLVDEGTLEYGDVIVTEIFPDPEGSDKGKEWFEVRNTTDVCIDLSGWIITDEDLNTHEMPPSASLVLGPEESAVLAQSDVAAENGDLPWVLYAYGDTWSLSTNDDLIALYLEDDLIFFLEYDATWPYDSGIAAQLDPNVHDAVEAGDPTNWCEAVYATWFDGVGTPGTDNSPCGECIDADNDGSCIPDDCDDFDETVYPDANELCTDGADNDCDGDVDFDDSTSDIDGDGWCVDMGDCDENNPDIHPDAIDIWDEAQTDQDCDGRQGEDSVDYGDLLITEFFPNPDGSDGDGEWFEIYNNGLYPIDLSGWRLYDLGVNDCTLPLSSSILLGAGEIAVLAQSADPAANGDLPSVLYPYETSSDDPDNTCATWILGNGTDGDEIYLSVEDRVIASLEYTGDWPFASGVAAQLDPSAFDPARAQDESNWCAGTDATVFAGAGTPGDDNDACFVCVDDDEDGWCDKDDCDDNDPDIHPGAIEDCNDGTDNDCDEAVDAADSDCNDLEDRDQDGYPSNTDCDDNDPLTYPGANELLDEKDNDCDELVNEGLLVYGDLLITEFLPDPAGSDKGYEWIEVYNDSEYPIDLSGWEMYDLDNDEAAFPLEAGRLVIAPGAFAVLAQCAASCGDPGDPCPDSCNTGGIPGELCRYDGGWVLANTGDEIYLALEGFVIISLEYDDSWPFASGVSAQLDPEAFDGPAPEDPASWCESVEQGAFDGTGTPGSSNTVCEQ